MVIAILNSNSNNNNNNDNTNVMIMIIRTITITIHYNDNDLISLVCYYVDVSSTITRMNPPDRAPEHRRCHEAAGTTGLRSVGVGALRSPQLVPNRRGQSARTRREDGGCLAAGEISGTEIPISSPLYVYGMELGDVQKSGP